MQTASGALKGPKSIEAERRVSLLRLLVVAQGSLTVLTLVDPAATIAWLADALMALSWAYSIWMVVAQPYRRWPWLISAYFAVVLDTLFIAVWVYATGGPDSPFILLAYLSVFAVAFRHSAREAILAAVAYDLAYVALLVSRHELAHNPAVTFTRMAYVFFAATIGAFLVGQVSDHATATSSSLAREKQSRAELVASEARSRFTAEAGKALASSLDYEQTLSNVARLLVPMLGDYCVVDVVDGNGDLQRVAEAARDPDDLPLLRELRAFPVTPTSLVGSALRKSETVVVEDVDEAAGLAELSGGRGEGYARIIRQLDLRTMVSLPLFVHGYGFGTMSLGTSERPRVYTPEELRLAEEIALRAALAIEHARLYRDAREAIRTRDEFMSIASHELRTPLNVMLLQTDGLLRQAKKDQDARLSPALERIKRQVNRLGALVESLLDVSRITAGRLSLDLADVDLGGVVAEVVGRLRDDVSRAGATIEILSVPGREGVPDRGEIVGHWDRLRIDQIVTNLLSNAIKYGGGKPIQVELSVVDDRALLTVIDHGIGIDKENQARIFERFERAVSSKHYGGFGLGLWIVRQIIQAHGGDISIRSRIGEGSTFIAELPLAGPTSRTSSPPPSEPDGHGQAEGRV
jgi:signal transduction histidine kinase